MFVLLFFINAENNKKMDFEGENPLHAIDIPVASLVVIEVEGVPILDPKRLTFYETLAKSWLYIQLSGAILMIIGILAGFILLLVWLYNPCTFDCMNNAAIRI
jgi:hypothetical protein